VGKEYATMEKSSGKLIEFPTESTKEALTEVLRKGAQQMLAAAIEAEVETYLSHREHLVDEEGHRVVVGKGNQRDSLRLGEGSAFDTIPSSTSHSIPTSRYRRPSTPSSRFFRRTGSANATMKAFRAQGIRFPHRVRTGPAKGEVVWGEAARFVSRGPVRRSWPR
jgi:hypothetical protein